MIGRADRAWSPTAPSRLPYLAAGCVAGASLWMSLRDPGSVEAERRRGRRGRSLASSRRSE